MENHPQATDGEGTATGRVSSCCIVQLVALLGCVWTGVSLGVTYAHGDPLLLAAGQVLLGLLLGLIAGVLAALGILWIDHVTAGWPLRRYGQSQQDEGRGSGTDDEPEQ